MRTFAELPTPCFVVDEAKLIENGRILRRVQDETGCRILLAQKAFSCFPFYPLLRPYLAGTAASGLYEARLGRERFGGETHVYAPAFRPDVFPELLEYADHIVFNSISQLQRFGPMAKGTGKQVGLRLNPEHSTQEGHAIYDPCAPGSRLGVTRRLWDAQMDENTLALLDGLHFHTLCEQNAGALESTLDVVLEKWADVLPRMRWLNCGGGHHITRADYEMQTLYRCIRRIQALGLTVYLEPGEAVALDAGYLVATVLDLPAPGLAILDTSAACHMPDVLEMPYRPPLLGSGAAGEKPYSYRLGAPTCLAGDQIGEYSFDHPLAVGDRLVFGDMAIYSMVKTNTFNGMPLPAIAALRPNGRCEVLRSFGYADFEMRLG